MLTIEEQLTTLRFSTDVDSKEDREEIVRLYRLFYKFRTLLPADQVLTDQLYSKWVLGHE